MRYIKTYESVKNKLNVLSDYLLEFIKEIEISDTASFIYTNSINSSEYSFWYNENINLRKGLFKLSKIDYFYDDLDMFFEFKLDCSMNYKTYLPTEILTLFEFISDSITKYNNSQNMIKMSDIKNIISDINVENYKIFIDANKYNL